MRRQSTGVSCPSLIRVKSSAAPGERDLWQILLAFGSVLCYAIMRCSHSIQMRRLDDTLPSRLPESASAGDSSQDGDRCARAADHTLASDNRPRRQQVRWAKNSKQVVGTDRAARRGRPLSKQKQQQPARPGPAGRPCPAAHWHALITAFAAFHPPPGRQSFKCKPPAAALIAATMGRRPSLRLSGR